VADAEPRLARRFANKQSAWWALAVFAECHEMFVSLALSPCDDTAVCGSESEGCIPSLLLLLLCCVSVYVCMY
jgi:hypothetical protein